MSDPSSVARKKSLTPLRQVKKMLDPTGNTQFIIGQLHLAKLSWTVKSLGDILLISLHHPHKLNIPQAKDLRQLLT